MCGIIHQTTTNEEVVNHSDSEAFTNVYNISYIVKIHMEKWQIVKEKRI